MTDKTDQKDADPHFACPNCGHEQSKLRTIFECYWPKRGWASKIGGEGIRAVIDCIAPGFRRGFPHD